MTLLQNTVLCIMRSTANLAYVVQEQASVHPLIAVARVTRRARVESKEWALSQVANVWAPEASRAGGCAHLPDPSRNDETDRRTSYVEAK